MATNKKKTIQTNTPGWSQAPDTADMTDLRGLRDQGGDYATPIRNQYARAEQKMSRSYNNPMGAYTTADVRDKAMREQSAQLDQNMAIDLGNAAQQNADKKFGRYAQIAGMTAPQFYMQKSENSQPFVGGDLLSTGLGIGSAFLT